MTTIAKSRRAPLAATARVSLLAGRVPSLVWIVGLSRLLITAVGAFTTVGYKPFPGWSAFDPTRVTTSLGSVGNALTGASVRWDSIHYLSVAIHGYKPAGDTRFFPLYPLMIHALSWIVRSDVAAGLLISWAAFATALVLLYRLTSEELGERAAKATVLLVAFAPLSFFFTALYTESLLLAFTVGAFYLARHDRFVSACIVGGLAAMTHGEGIAIFAPLAYMYWERRGKAWSPRKLLAREAFALLVPIAAFVSVFAYDRASGFGWLAPITDSRSSSHAHLMVVNTHSTIPQGSQALGPLVTIWRALIDGISGLWQQGHAGSPVGPSLNGPFPTGIQNFIYLVILTIALLSLVAAWKRLPRAYAIYATLVVCVFTSRVMTPQEPLLSFDRYMLAAFPLWMSAAAWLEDRGVTRRVVQLSTVLLVLYTVEFTRWVMVA